MSLVSELAPCPFCGSDELAPEADDQAAPGSVGIGCKECGALGPIAARGLRDVDASVDLATEASELWNQRVAPLAPLVYSSNGEAGDGQHHCSGCLEERDEPHAWEECAGELLRGRDMIMETLIRRDNEIDYFRRRQDTIARWIRRVIGDAALENPRERALRVVEEAVELGQSLDLDAAIVHRLVDYVYSRPVGEPSQEIAGTLVTVYGAAAALGVDADDALGRELVRIHTPEVEAKVRRRQAEKRAVAVAAEGAKEPGT